MKKTCFVIIAFCFAVAACGGSSGGGPAALGPGSSGSRVPQLPDLPRPPIVASPPPANTSSVASLEGYYQNHYEFSLAGGEFESVKLDRAYANLYQARGANAATRPGNGVTIGFVDDGLDTAHPAFDGKRMTVEYFGTASAGSELAEANSSSHGTSVASIAAGVRKGWLYARLAVTSEGVAPGADIRMFAHGGTSVQEATIAALNPARNVDILNLSIGFPNEEDGSYQHGIITDSRYANASSSDFQAEIQAGRVEKTLFVWAAGNEYGAPCPSMSDIESCQGGAVNASSPSPPAGAMYLVEELRPHSVAVVSVNAGSDGTISEFSNRCGVAADWCIAAPGEGIGVATSQRMPDGSIERSIAVSLEGVFRDSGGDGTSFAAPIVSGGLAIMKQQFRGQLSNVQLLARMLSTATKTGIYADRSIYGQGLLNLGAATNPVGEMTVSAAGPEFVNDDGWQFAPLRDTRLQVGEAFGDGVSKSLAGNEIAAFDSLGAPFWFPLESVAVKTERSILENQLQTFMDFPAERTAKADGVPLPPLSGEPKPETADGPSGYGAGQFEISVSMARGQTGGQSGLKNGHISFVENPFSFSVGGERFSVSAFTSDERELKPAHGAVVSYRLRNLPLGFRSGFITESKSVLGTTAEGAFGGLRAQTVFAGMDYDYSFGDWQVVANAEMGVAYPENKSGLITSASQLATSSFAVGLIRELSGGAKLKFSVSSPLRVESGHMDLTVPVGRTPEGGIVRNTVTANFEPSGRQIDFGAQIVAPFSFGDISVGTVATRHPGHDENADPQVSFLAGYALNI